MHLTKDKVIQKASELVDKEGLNNLSLKILAEELNIRTPSLYNHIKSQDELLREIAHRGMRTMNAQMTQAAIGVIGDIAIKAVSLEYFRFVIAHPGVYETIQWAGWHRNVETSEILNKYDSLLQKIILSCNLNPNKADIILTLLKGIFHGYTTMQIRQAIENAETTKENFIEIIDTILFGINHRYKTE